MRWTGLPLTTLACYTAERLPEAVPGRSSVAGLITGMRRTGMLAIPAIIVIEVPARP